MHDYAIDSNKRRAATVIVVLLYAVLMLMVAYLMESFIEPHIDSLLQNLKLTFLSSNKWLLDGIGMIVGIVIPGMEIGVAYALFDRYLWKARCVSRIHKIPNLNGDWIAHVNAPLKHPLRSQGLGYDTEIHMKIKQTWMKISVTGISQNGTRTTSYSGSIADRDGMLVFSYSYYIEPSRGRGAGQRYQGFNSLYYDNGKLEGEYFSGKDVSDAMETYFMQRISDSAARADVMRGLEGCGSKGRIFLEKV